MIFIHTRKFISHRCGGIPTRFATGWHTVELDKKSLFLSIQTGYVVQLVVTHQLVPCISAHAEHDIVNTGFLSDSLKHHIEFCPQTAVSYHTPEYVA